MTLSIVSGIGYETINSTINTLATLLITREEARSKPVNTQPTTTTRQTHYTTTIITTYTTNTTIRSLPRVFAEQLWYCWIVVSSSPPGKQKNE